MFRYSNHTLGVFPVELSWQFALHVFRNPSLNSFNVSPKVINRPEVNWNKGSAA